MREGDNHTHGQDLVDVLVFDFSSFFVFFSGPSNLSTFAFSGIRLKKTLVLYQCIFIACIQCNDYVGKQAQKNKFDKRALGWCLCCSHVVLSQGENRESECHMGVGVGGERQRGIGSGCAVAGPGAHA